MKNIIIILISILSLVGCNNLIKDNDAKILIEDGTAIDSAKNDIVDEFFSDKIDTTSHIYWVGYFDPHKDIDMRDKHMYADEGLYWSRSNKISISIDKILGDSIIGHSVVAGNHRPFYGKVLKSEEGRKYIVKEPGDDKYDGQFTFEIIDNYINGIWEAYKSVEIPKREYKLDQMSYVYNPDIMLERAGRYGNWEKFIDHGTQIEIFDEGTPDEQVYEWVKREYASSTEKIYEINASNKVLTKEDVENLTNSDLVVIRNTIYARHGYSFKNRPLRVFFDSQDWYIPVHADIKQDFTEIEKKNIQLLLRYEKNAKEYYDYFGRG